MTGGQLTGFAMLGMIACVMAIVALLDWIGQRQHARQRRERAHRS